MESFGSELNVLNKDYFKSIFKERCLEKLRKHIYNFMLERNKENDFFDIDIFNRKYIKNMDIMNELVNKAVIELLELGWKTHIGFGGTGLYIYSSDELPDGVY